jgi:hypothetical protein
VTVGVRAQAVADLRGQLADLGDERLERFEEREDDLAARFDLLVAGAPDGGALEFADQLLGLLAA